MPWYVAVYEVLLQVSLAGCALLALAAVAVTLLREPARKARVIELTMLGLIALPALVLIPGYPRVALLPAEAVEYGEEAVVPRVDTDAKNPPAKPGAERVGHAFQPPALPGDSVVPGDSGVADAPSPKQAPVVAGDIESPTPTPSATRSSDSPYVATAVPSRPDRSLFDNIPTDYRFWIVAAYFIGVALMLGYALLGMLAIRRLARTSQPADAALQNALGEITGSHARVRLLVSSRVAQPCAFGWFRPTIVLPERLAHTGDARQLRFALAHEWSHISRGDLRAWLLSSVARVLHFQQPLVWLLRGRLRLAQDYLADAAAAGTATSLDYAEFLTAISQTARRPQLAPGLGIAGRRSDLHRRVVMLVENNYPLERVAPRRWNVVALLLVISCVAAVASLRAAPGQPVESAPHANARADDNEVPLELRPERIREVAKQHFQLTLDAELADLQRQLALKRAESANGGEPDMLLERQIETLELSIALRKAQLSGLRYGSKPKPLSSLEQYLRIEDELRQLRTIYDGLATQPDKEEEARRVSKEILRCEQEIYELLKMHRAANTDDTAGNSSELLGTIRPPSDKQIEALLAEDSLIAQLTEQLRAYQDQLQRLRAVATPDSLKTDLQREVLRLEEAISERKAELRAKAAEFLQHSRLSEAAKAAAMPHRNSPFSGTIRPGDILRIDIVGGFPAKIEPIRTVEPDGNLPLGAVYAPKSRIHVAGKSLIEAGQQIENELRTLLRDPHVLLTYEGHDDGVVPTGQGRSVKDPQVRSPALKVVLQPLDTIEVTLGAKMNNAAFPSGTYLIEPDGTVALFDRRLRLADMSEHDAGEALRAYMSSQPWLLKAPPSIHVQQRGRAVFPENETPTADYRVQPGDRLLASSIGSAVDGMLLTVSDDGLLTYPEEFVGQKLPPVEVQGKTLDEVQQVLRADWKFPNGLPQNLVEYPWTVTFGGWHEEADPAVIDRIEGGGSPRAEQLEQELREIKALIREINR